MNFKRLFLTDKFNKENTVAQFRWINDTLQNNNLKMYKHSWNKNIVKKLLNILLEQNKLLINDLRTENYYQDREKNWSVTNEGIIYGYQIVDNISYIINDKQPIITLNIQKRDSIQQVNIPNIQNSEKICLSKRHHLVIYLNELITLHIGIPLKNDDNYQIWMECPTSINDVNYDILNYWTKHIHILLKKIEP